MDGCLLGSSSARPMPGKSHSSSIASSRRSNMIRGSSCRTGRTSTASSATCSPYADPARRADRDVRRPLPGDRRRRPARPGGRDGGRARPGGASGGGAERAERAGRSATTPGFADSLQRALTSSTPHSSAMDSSTATSPGCERRTGPSSTGSGCATARACGPVPYGGSPRRSTPGCRAGRPGVWLRGPDGDRMVAARSPRRTNRGHGLDPVRAGPGRLRVARSHGGRPLPARRGAIRGAVAAGRRDDPGCLAPPGTEPVRRR